MIIIARRIWIAGVARRSLQQLLRDERLLADTRLIMTGQNAARHRTTNWINPDKDNAGPQGAPDWNWRGLEPGDVTLARRPACGRLSHDTRRQRALRSARVSRRRSLEARVRRQRGRRVRSARRAAITASRTTAQAANGPPPACPAREVSRNRNVFDRRVDDWKRNGTWAKPSQAEKPFYLYFAQYAVHAPFNSDPRFASHYATSGKPANAQAFATLIEGMDKSLGDVLDHLDVARRCREHACDFPRRQRQRRSART
jgi:arylsulfatase A-like enzyme